MLNSQQKSILIHLNLYILKFFSTLKLLLYIFNTIVYGLKKLVSCCSSGTYTFLQALSCSFTSEVSEGLHKDTYVLMLAVRLTLAQFTYI